MDMEQLLSGNTESSSTGTHGARDTGLVLLLLYPELRAAPVEHYGEIEHIRQLC